MKKLALLIVSCFLAFPLSANFIKEQKELEPYSSNENVIVIASSGRSGSTFLTEVIEEKAPQKVVLKMHRLPPKGPFAGKIIFIFSNPDKAAESAFHRSLNDPLFGVEHFIHLEGADKAWIQKLHSSAYQTVEHNLLAYDALGIEQHLKQWLTLEKAGSLAQANVLAVKYEHLWDENTKEALAEFLGVKKLSLPQKRKRGQYTLSPKERRIRSFYNVGTGDDPRYEAYEKARALWEEALPFQPLVLKR